MFFLTKLLSLILAIFFISLGPTSYLTLFFMAFMGVSSPFNDNFEIIWSKIMQGRFGAIFFISLYLILKATKFDFKKGFLILWENLFFVLFFIFSLLSSLWSLNPDHTLISTLFPAFFYISAIFVFWYFKSSEITKVFNTCLVLILISSLIIGAYNLNTAIKEDGFWVGAFSHKNNLGFFCSFAVIFFLFQKSTMSWFLRCFFIGLAIYLLIMSKSATALVAVILASSTIPLIWKIRKKVLRPSLLITVFLSLFWLTLFSSLLPSSFFEALGKDSTLTGRDKIYATILQNVSGYRSIIGYGSGNFVVGYESVNFANQKPLSKLPILKINQPIDIGLWTTESGLTYSHAHNQILQFYAELGLIGVFLFLAILWSTFKKLYFMAQFQSLFPELKLLMAITILTIISIQTEPRLTTTSKNLLWLPLLWIHGAWNSKKHLIPKPNSR